MSSLGDLLPSYSSRIEELREFRDEYNSTISRIEGNDRTPVAVEIDEELKNSTLQSLNDELKQKLEPRDDPEDGHYVAPVENREEIIQELEGLVEYADNRIKELKRRKLGWTTTIVTFVILALIIGFDLYTFY